MFSFSNMDFVERGAHVGSGELKRGTEQVSSICTSLFVFNIQSWCICVSCVLFTKPPLTQVYTHSTPLGGRRGFVVFFKGFLLSFFSGIVFFFNPLSMSRLLSMWK